MFHQALLYILLFANTVFAIARLYDRLRIRPFSTVYPSATLPHHTIQHFIMNMKKALRFFSLALALVFIAAVRLSAQDVIEFPDINTLTPENIFQAAVEPVYSALIILFGYLSAYIPGIKKMNTYLRVLAFALVAGLGFYLFGGESFWKVAITYFVTTRFLYDGLLKKVTDGFVSLLKKKGNATAANNNT